MTDTKPAPGRPVVVRARPVYLDTRELARRYGVNHDTARRWLRTGRLPAIKIGTEYRVRLDDLERLERQSYNSEVNDF